jgi:DNA-binding NarL/FixJ family response regulator
MIKVLVADDHNLMIDGIKTTLSDVADIKIIAEASNGLDVLKLLESHKVDVILMDISMPYMDGLDCTKIVTEKFPSTKVIALSQFNEPRFVKRMMKNGSSGYLLKDSRKEELVNAIRLVFQGEQYFDKNLQINNTTFNHNTAKKNKELSQLTKREIEVLTLICNEFSTQNIADQLSISYNTVERHRANLIEKLGLKNTAGLVRWAIENDLVK